MPGSIPANSSIPGTTRHLTLVWALFFCATALVSALLAATAPAVVWFSVYQRHQLRRGIAPVPWRALGPPQSLCGLFVSVAPRAGQNPVALGRASISEVGVSPHRRLLRHLGSHDTIVIRTGFLSRAADLARALPYMKCVLTCRRTGCISGWLSGGIAAWNDHPAGHWLGALPRVKYTASLAPGRDSNCGLNRWPTTRSRFA